MPTDPYIGEIMMFGGNYAPPGWLPCDGRLLPIAVYDTLFTLLGSSFGGDGENTFALPDLRGRCIIGAGSGPGLMARSLGETVGTETVTLLESQLPAHAHSLSCVGTPGDAPTIAGRVPASAPTDAYSDTAAFAQISSPEATSFTGGGQGHNNMQPFQAINYCICVEGIYPPRP